VGQVMAASMGMDGDTTPFRQRSLPFTPGILRLKKSLMAGCVMSRQVDVALVATPRRNT